MRPRPLPTLVVVSAICCVLLCGLWAASWWRIVGVDYVRPDVPSMKQLACADGLCLWTWRRGGSGGYGHEGFLVWAEGPDLFRDGHGPDLREAAVGFSVTTHGHIGRSGAGLVMVPLWFPILLTAVPPAWWWIRRKRRAGARGFEVGTASPE